jgi:hypothetical protein
MRIQFTLDLLLVALSFWFFGLLWLTWQAAHASKLGLWARWTCSILRSSHHGFCMRSVEHLMSDSTPMDSMLGPLEYHCGISLSGVTVDCDMCFLALGRS